MIIPASVMGNPFGVTSVCEALFYVFYNAVTQNNCFVKGSRKYDVYLRDKNKTDVNWLKNYGNQFYY